MRAEREGTGNPAVQRSPYSAEAGAGRGNAGKIPGEPPPESRPLLPAGKQNPSGGHAAPLSFREMRPGKGKERTPGTGPIPKMRNLPGLPRCGKPEPGGEAPVAWTVSLL